MSKILFISYSHDSEAHKAWVKKFANDLENLGDFEVLLDLNMPKGFPLTRFMEETMTETCRRQNSLSVSIKYSILSKSLRQSPANKCRRLCR